MKTYLELIQLTTFKERLAYLSIDGNVGQETFGADRYLNQKFYRSPEWKKVRQSIIIRDNGNDLGIENRPIFGHITIHHLNPITIEDINNRSPKLFDPNNLICVSTETHKKIHYGDRDVLKDFEFNSRKPGDTKLW